MSLYMRMLTLYCGNRAPDQGAASMVGLGLECTNAVIAHELATTCSLFAPFFSRCSAAGPTTQQHAFLPSLTQLPSPTLSDPQFPVPGATKASCVMVPFQSRDTPATHSLRPGTHSTSFCGPQCPVRDAMKALGANVGALSEADLRPVVLRDFQMAAKAQRASVTAAEIERRVVVTLYVRICKSGCHARSLSTYDLGTCCAVVNCRLRQHVFVTYCCPRCPA